MLLRLHKTQYTYPTVTLNIYEALYYTRKLICCLRNSYRCVYTCETVLMTKWSISKNPFFIAASSITIIHQIRIPVASRHIYQRDQFKDKSRGSPALFFLR